MSSLALGPTPAGEVIAELERLRAGDDSVVLAERLSFGRTLALTMLGRVEESRQACASRNAVAEELGRADSTQQISAIVELAAGTPERAEPIVREAYERHRDAGHTLQQANNGFALAPILYALGRYDEAEDLAREVEELGSPDDLALVVVCRGVRAKCAARSGAFDDARALARGATDLTAGSDFLNMIGDAWFDRAEVERLAGDVQAEQEALPLRTALELYERKENLVMAGRVRELLG